MKGNIKRIGLVLLTLLTLSLGTLVVNAETKDSDFVIENGVLKQYKGNDDTVYIPEGVTKITSDAFKREYSDYEKWGMYSGDMTERDNSFMLKDKFYARKIVLSPTVKEIESFAIPRNTEELVLNEGLEILDDAALYNVSATTLEIPSTLKKIGNDAFSLTVKKITGNCIEVELADRAFSYTKNLRDKTFISAGDLRVLELAGVKNIPRGLFSECRKITMMSLTGNYAEIKATDLRKLKNLRAVNTSKAIQGNLKEYCKKLKNNKITVSSEMKKFGKFLIENKKLIEYTGNSEVVKIPKGVKVIDDIVFRGENKIRKIVMPNTVRTIGKEAFDSCERLIEIKFSKKLTKIGDYAFSNCTRMKKYNLPKTVKSIGKCAFRWNYSLKTVNVPKKVKTIQFATFENCVNLKKVNMKSVTSIERRAFCGDKKLKKVKLNKKVKVGKKAFLFTKVKGQKTT